jgi:drug/metabolite transporter (DMT)-like permease
VRDPQELVGYGAAAFAGIQVGAAMVATRLVAGDVEPFTLALLRYAIAVAVLVPFAWSIFRIPFRRADLAPLFGLGVLQFGILIALLNFGLEHVSATRGALLFSTFPILTMLLAAAIGTERLTAVKSAGVGLAFLGVAVTLGENLLAETRPGEWLGALAVLGSALSGAVCSIFYRPYLARYPTLPVGVLAMISAVLFLALPSVHEGLLVQQMHLAALQWWAVLFIGASSALGFVLWLSALKFTSPTRATTFLSLSPIAAALLEVTVLGEALTIATVLGVTLVVAGLVVVTRPGALPVGADA